MPPTLSGCNIRLLSAGRCSYREWLYSSATVSVHHKPRDYQATPMPGYSTPAPNRASPFYGISRRRRKARKLSRPRPNANVRLLRAQNGNALTIRPTAPKKNKRLPDYSTGKGKARLYPLRHISIPVRNNTGYCPPGDRRSILPNDNKLRQCCRGSSDSCRVPALPGKPATPHLERINKDKLQTSPKGQTMFSCYKIWILSIYKQSLTPTHHKGNNSS